MKPAWLISSVVLFCVTAFPAVAASIADASADLGFETRVRAQRAIERVYQSHRIDASEDLDAAVPRMVLEAKVRRFLRQSQALERHWRTPVSGFMLDRELERMVRKTLDPERLWELFAALDADGGDCYTVRLDRARQL